MFNSYLMVCAVLCFSPVLQTGMCQKKERKKNPDELENHRNVLDLSKRSIIWMDFDKERYAVKIYMDMVKSIEWTTVSMCVTTF